MKRKITYLIQKGIFGMVQKTFLFFVFLFTSVSFAQQWDYLGKENDLSTLVSAYTTVAVINESGTDVPYVGFAENSPAPASNAVLPGPGLLVVKKRLADGTWQQVGQNISNSGLYMRIYANNLNELFVAYIDATNSSKLAVRKYNAGTNSWDALGGNSANLLVSTGSAHSNYVSNTFNGLQRLSMSFDANNVPYVIYSEPLNVVTVKRFNSTTLSWEVVGNDTTVIGVSGSIAFIGSDIYMSYLGLTAVGANGGSLKLFKLNTATNIWDSIAVPVAATGATSLTSMRHPVMIANTSTTLCFAYMNTNATLAGSAGSNRTFIAYYDSAAASGSEWSGYIALGSSTSTNISLVKDSANNVYCSFLDGITSSGFFNTQRVRFQKAGTTVWADLKNPSVTRGIDEPAGWSAIGIANGSTTPHIVYTKGTTASGVVTPVVRKYNAPISAPVITSYSFATSTATPPVVTLTINGSNFTGTTDISLNSTSANGVPSPFTVVNDTQITYVVPGATVAPTLSQITVTTPNGTATLNATPPSALTYAAYPAIYNGNPIVVSSVTPSDLLLYSIAPALPTGLSINRGNGTISGQSTTVAASTAYVVTATNSFGTTTATVTFETLGTAPSGLTYAPAVSASYTVGTTITPLVATTTNGTGATYTVIPALPAGLVLNSATGEISGTPTAAADFKNYEVKATTSAGFTSRVIAFSVTSSLSTSDFVNGNQVTLYPNPTANGIVTVDYPSAFSGAKLTIINTLGQVIFQTTVGDTTHAIETSGLHSGLYFVKLESSNNSVVKKLVLK
ncbi:putative Ig domain-containing protein [Flavobacterium eburneipallidum]|uniref:putative Ig domain-containing protein n=1 Tax=Flavobacterium eburneipallidum TaxID=3003263 RepID=UPI0024827711|nr:putative Ig domain-containing protein [Flavobacterium eburneipallidum]